MNDLPTPPMKPSAARSATLPATEKQRPILVWDAPVRVFHWLMVLAFAGAYLTAEGERWQLLHITLGYTMMGLVGFRIIWGLIGTRYARFAQFVHGPRAALRYLGAMLRGRPEHYTGHNPAGALAILAMLSLALAVTLTGWSLYQELGGHALKEVHEFFANAMLALVGVHVAAVLLSSRIHRENLVGAMLTGRKPGRPQDAIRRSWRSVAALLLAAVLGFWWLQWQGGPAGAGPDQATAANARQHRHDPH